MALMGHAFYSAANFLESAGCVLVHKTGDSVLLLQSITTKEWVLPKGRRNTGESRADCALRETKEETGYPCRLLNVKFDTRATPADERNVTVPDIARPYEGDQEPIALTTQQSQDWVKLIWWYMAEPDDGMVGRGEDQYKREWVAWGALPRYLTFADERRVVERARNVMVTTILLEHSREGNDRATATDSDSCE